MLLVGQQEGHRACKKLEWWGAGMVICLERGADLHMVQQMPLLLTVCCSSKIQIGFTFLVPAHLRSPTKGPLNVCVCVRVCVRVRVCVNWHVETYCGIAECLSQSYKWMVQDSVAMQLWWVGNVCHRYIDSFLRNLTVKEFWKCVHIFWCYDQKLRVLFFSESHWWDFLLGHVKCSSPQCTLWLFWFSALHK